MDVNRCNGTRIGLGSRRAMTAGRPSLLEVRRCRPMLGTFVEVAASGSNAADLECGIDAAFSVVGTVHRLMSFHDPESELSRINREARFKPVRVHPWTWRILKYAGEFSCESNGLFDITMARQLVRWNYLPVSDVRLVSGNWRDIVLDDECTVRFRRPVIIDLGGIGKGFAVDRAVEALKHNGVAAGIVNAGGDLRVFGPASQLVHVRHPAEPRRIAGAVRLRERAMATSGIYFERRKYRGKDVAPLVDGHTGQPRHELISVSVGARECMIADALTKIVFAAREKAAGLLARYGADALLLERNGAPSWRFHSPCDTPRQT